MICIFGAMRKKNTITIDLDVWTTPANKARALGLSESAIRQRVLRTKKGTATASTKEEYKEIPELNLILVKK